MLFFLEKKMHKSIKNILRTFINILQSIIVPKVSKNRRIRTNNMLMWQRYYIIIILMRLCILPKEVYPILNPFISPSMHS